MAINIHTRLMRSDEIPAFVEAIIETGCDICAVGQEFYVIGDADLSDAEFDVARPKLHAIDKQFGDRDFLRSEIVAHLRSLGRYIDTPEVRHWSENVTPN